MLMTNMTQPTLSPDDFKVIRDFIYEKAGMWFADNKQYLVENRLTKRMAELGIISYRDYFYRVKYDTSNKEFDILMNLVTTNETSFFRNPPQLLAFSEEVLPLLIKKKIDPIKSTKRLKIWSAGCSTGEEPYTIAIILLEVLKSTLGWNIEIIANDISQQVLYSARKGVYQESTLRTTEPRIIERYFVKEQNSYWVKDEVKQLVKFNHINLNDGHQVTMISDCDVIFCRNVMIYFTDDVKRGLIKQFYKSLKPGGFLFIGHSESLHGISKSFKLEYFRNALVYQKEVALTDAIQTTADRVSSTHLSTMDTLAKIKTLLEKK